MAIYVQFITTDSDSNGHFVPCTTNAPEGNELGPKKRTKLNVPSRTNEIDARFFTINVKKCQFSHTFDTQPSRRCLCVVLKHITLPNT